MLFEFAKAVVDGIAVDVELFGGCLSGAVVVEPGLQSFKKDGSLFVGEPGESGQSGLGEVVHHLGGADRGGSKQIPVEERDATMGERAGESDTGQGEGLGSGAQVAVGRADPHASSRTSREGVGESVELGGRSGEGDYTDLDVGQQPPGRGQPDIAQGLLTS